MAPWNDESRLPRNPRSARCLGSWRIRSRAVDERWSVVLRGEEQSLRELEMHFNGPELRVARDGDTVYLTSTDFDAIGDGDTGAIRRRATELLAVASGSLTLEFGSFAPPYIEGVFHTDKHGTKHHYASLSAKFRLNADVNARVERVREDGRIEVVELVAPPPQTSAWAHGARSDENVEDVLAILGRGEVRWHDLYHVFEVVQTDVGSAMFDRGWATQAEADRFTQTANSKLAVGREARHGHKKVPVPSRGAMAFSDGQRLVLRLVGAWLDWKIPPPPAREVVLEVRDAPDAPATSA